jgi:hypothetical protein
LELTIPAKDFTSWNVRVARGGAALSLFAALATQAALAQTASPAPSESPTAAAAPATPAPPSGDCSLVGPEAIAQILGYPVSAADNSSKSGGICFFPSSAVAADGSASYALVDEDRLQQRKAYYAVLARRCANPPPGPSQAAVCKSFTELAQAKNMDDYFAARTDFPNTEAVKGLGDAAVAAGDALYVKRGDVVYEVVVRRGDALDLDRATTLAKLLLARTPAPAAPEPSPSPRRPKAS